MLFFILGHTLLKQKHFHCCPNSCGFLVLGKHQNIFYSTVHPKTQIKLIYLVQECQSRKELYTCLVFKYNLYDRGLINSLPFPEHSAEIMSNFLTLREKIVHSQL